MNEVRRLRAAHFLTSVVVGFEPKAEWRIIGEIAKVSKLSRVAAKDPAQDGSGRTYALAKLTQS